MKKLCDMNRSKYSILAMSVIVFAVMLIFNSMTPYLADDYVYRYSFEDARQITSFAQIPASMYYHSQMMNGRVISHGLEQMFMIFPKFVFNIINAMVFTACIYIVYKICMPRKKHSACVFFLVFATLWYFTPAFGQVFLWQVGAINYLWSVFFSLLFLYPYVDMYKNKEYLIQKSLWIILFSMFALVVGLYSEIASFIAIAAATVFVVLKSVTDKKRPSIKETVPIVCAGIGFGLLVMMPVEITAKVSESLSPAMLIKNFGTCTKMLDGNLKALVIIWAFLWVVGLYNKSKKNCNSTIFSLVFALFGMASNYMMIIGTYFPERTMLVASTFLIIACLVMVIELMNSNFDWLVAAISMGFCVVFSFSFVYGTYDIYNCYGEFSLRESEIIQKRNNGERNLAVQIIYPQTKYSPFYDVVDLNCETTQSWPNITVAMYYGIDSIIGMQ